jgi:hypothetical protein
VPCLALIYVQCHIASCLLNLRPKTRRGRALSASLHHSHLAASCALRLRLSQYSRA